MASVNDWAAKAAQRIINEPLNLKDRRSQKERFAAIIATFAEPLMTLLRDSKREHHHCEDSWYCCGKCSCSCMHLGDDSHEHDEDCWPSTHSERTSGVCNCGADAWNTRVEAVLAGKPESGQG